MSNKVIKYKCQSPILLVAFNRPDNTLKVLSRIREVRPDRLYIAVDGARKNKPGEAKRCQKVRNIATKVDWECAVETLFRDNNLGCKHAVSGAIDWFFEHEEYGIILEDDCVPNVTFFKFCDILLDKYYNEDGVMTISGDNYQPYKRTQNSYYFSKYMHCWGWATWRRAWKNFDLQMQDWSKLKDNDFLLTLFSNRKDQRYWRQKFDGVQDGLIDSWAYIWQYSIWKSHGVNILPEVNLVRNIGFGKEATHTKQQNSKASHLQTKPLSFPLQHPRRIEVNQQADYYTQKNQFRLSFFKKLKNKINQVVFR